MKDLGLIRNGAYIHLIYPIFQQGNAEVDLFWGSGTFTAQADIKRAVLVQRAEFSAKPVSSKMILNLHLRR